MTIKPKSKREKKYTTKNVSIIDGKKLAYQTTDNDWGSFFHRIALLNDDDEIVEEGCGGVYQHPVISKLQGQIYIAVTEYYHGEPINECTVYRIASGDEPAPTARTVDERVDTLMRNALKADIQQALLVLKIVRDQKDIGAKRDFATAFIRLKDKLGDDFDDVLKVFGA